MYKRQEDVSTLEIKKILKNTIEEEDKKKPLPDDQLAEILKEKGYPLSRMQISEPTRLELESRFAEK